MDQRIQKIRLVTERYSELKGLHVAYAGALWVCFGTALYLRPYVDPLTLLATFVAVLVAYLPGKWSLDRYYRSRFGHIVLPRWRSSTLVLVPTLIVLSVTNELFAGGPLAGAFVFVAAGSLWVAVRDWPARRHHLVGCFAAALAASLQFTPRTAWFGKPQALGIAIIGLSYVPLGLLDHRLLTSVLRPRRETDAPLSADQE